MNSNSTSKPATARWCLHIEIEAHEPGLMHFRLRMDDVLHILPPWRATVLRADSESVAITCSVYGDAATDALSDAVAVVSTLDVPAGARIELISPDDLARRRNNDLPLLLGVAEVASISGYTKQWVSQLAKQPRNGFPPPAYAVQATPLWLRDEVVEWLDQRTDRSAPATRAKVVANPLKLADWPVFES